jgi:hypothetical protein
MNNAESHPRRIKNILINPKFQLKLMSYFSILFVLTTLSLYSTTLLFFWKMQQKAHSVGIPDEHVFYRFLSNQKSEFDSLFLGLAIFNFLLLIGTGFLVSHRIAGPIHKLKEYLSKDQAESSEFKLRDSDFFKELEPIVKNLKSHKDL